VAGEAVHADLTITIGAAKTGLLFHPGRSCTGQIEVIDIGFPQTVVEEHSDRVFYLGRDEAKTKLTPRPPDIHKYKAGSVLLIAGSDAYRGAPLLGGEAALRSGCGMLYLGVPESIRAEIPSSLEEAIVVPLEQTQGGTIAKSAGDALAAHAEKQARVAIGPGLGRNDETDAFVRDFVVNCTKPIVVDADALTAFAGHAGEFKTRKGPSSSPRMTASSHDSPARKSRPHHLERIAYSRATAQKLGVTLVHKGAPTLIASPDGNVWITAPARPPWPRVALATC
jgi:NAD(P)H-hydrate epimerase